MSTIIDLHSDLLSFLAHDEKRTVENPLARNSLPQMQAGGVKVQTLAIYARTNPRCVESATKQIAHWKRLVRSEHFAPLSKNFQLSPSCVHLIPAFENASGFALETESLSESLARLQDMLNTLGNLFYISMTWNEENRFGGGNDTSVGLKRNGEELLHWMHNKRIAIDLSHTSHRLASEIIEYSDKHALDIPLMASHSNFRSVTDSPRNLMDAIAREIIRRKGIIGMNLFAPFIHKTDPFVLLRHIEYGLSLGGQESLCFGADFFCDSDFPAIKMKYPDFIFFFDAYPNASSYPFILSELKNKLGLSQEILEQIAYKNAQRFLNAFIL
ncbi:MAG TPA: membrane dipeptidase [Rhabdochlamydiaceae bacterium]|jgi:microsomal dipeptidase-like Zn-dependent dipeptidase